MSIVIHRESDPAPNDAAVEIVERKGLGHPDSICDAIAEEFSRRLCVAYQEQVGHVLHHNVDKALLAAGSSEPRFGGGRVIAPARLILAGRAALEVDGAGDRRRRSRGGRGSRLASGEPSRLRRAGRDGRVHGGAAGIR